MMHAAGRSPPRPAPRTVPTLPLREALRRPDRVDAELGDGGRRAEGGGGR